MIFRSGFYRLRFLRRFRLPFPGCRAGIPRRILFKKFFLQLNHIEHPQTVKMIISFAHFPRGVPRYLPRPAVGNIGHFHFRRKKVTPPVHRQIAPLPFLSVYPDPV
jgi:hypothetical protein